MHITGGQLLGLAMFLGNVDADELADEGILRRNADGSHATSGSDWSRFNDDLVTFIAKLPDDRREKLADLISRRAPEFL